MPDYLVVCHADGHCYHGGVVSNVAVAHGAASRMAQTYSAKHQSFAMGSVFIIESDHDALTHAASYVARRGDDLAYDGPNAWRIIQ